MEIFRGNSRFRPNILLGEIVSYFMLSIAGGVGISLGIYLILLEPMQDVLYERRIPEVTISKASPGGYFSYIRFITQKKPCPAEIISRRLTCQNGYRYNYPVSSGNFPVGLHRALYEVRLPDNVPLGQCVFNVSLSFQCVLIKKHIELQPVEIFVVKQSGGAPSMNDLAR